MRVCLIRILFFILLAFSLEIHASESCQAVFDNNSSSYKAKGFTEKDFESVQSYAQLKEYAEVLISKETDIASLSLALGETQFARNSKWTIEDSLSFLLHLQTKYNLKIPNTKMPHLDPKLHDVNAIYTHFDFVRYVWAENIEYGMPTQIADQIRKAPYFSKTHWAPEGLYDGTQAIKKVILSFCKDHYSKTPIANIFAEKSEGLARANQTALSNKKRDAEFRKHLFGDEKENTVENPDLSIIWQVNFPENLAQVDSQYWLLRMHKKISVDYDVNPANADRPYMRVNRMMSTPLPDLRFFETVYKNYKDRIRDDIVQQVKAVEEKLPELRQSYGLVFESINQSVIGTIRVFDGTPRRLNDTFWDWRSTIPPTLPFEAIFNARKIPVNFIKKLEQMRKDSPYTPVFELGKLSLEGNSAKVNDRALKALELFLYDYYLTRYPDAIFVVHVASAAHLRLYQKRYGFEIEEKVEIPGTDQVEHILTLSAAKFKEALKLRLEL